jgi:hypothetical protein
VHNVLPLQQAQRQEKLLSISTDSPDIQANILAKTLYDIPKVHAEVLKDQAQVTSVLKRPLQPNDVFLILWIGLVELIEYLDFFQPCFVP